MPDPELPSFSYATRLLAASTKLAEPARSVFDRLFIRGHDEESVRIDLNLSSEAFSQAKSSALRTLMIAAQ